MNKFSDSIILWNPLVRKHITLPSPKSHSTSLVAPYTFILGFGYDAESKDFKVVRVTYAKGYCEDNFPPIVEIFSLKSRVWKVISTNLRQSWLTKLFWSQALVHGKLHWAACQMRLVEYHNGEMRKQVNLIMAFDFSSEVFEEIILPDPLINAFSTYISCIVYEKKLAFIVYELLYAPCKYSIWVMEEYGSRESWIKMFNMDFNFIGNVLGFTKGGYLVLTLTGRMVLYHPETNKISSLGIFSTVDSAFVDAYTESLALLIDGEQVLTSESDMVEDNRDDDDDDNIQQLSLGISQL